MSTETIAARPKGRARKWITGLTIMTLALGTSAGTGAYWYNSVTSEAVDIQFGDEFALEQTNYRAILNGQTVDLATAKVAPGDTVVLEYDYSLRSDAHSAVELAAAYVPDLSGSFPETIDDVKSWTHVDVTGDTVVNQGLEEAPFKVTLLDGEAEFMASATIAIPAELDNTWIGSAITYQGTMHVTQGDTVAVDPGDAEGVHEVARTEATVTGLGASTWTDYLEGSQVTLLELSNGAVQIQQDGPEGSMVVQYVEDATIDSLIADGYFTAN